MEFRQSTAMIFTRLFFLVLVAMPATGQVVELVNLQCDAEVMAASKCGAGGVFNGDGAFSGAMVCRKKWFGLFSSQTESVCAPTVLNQVIGYEDDTCGCCNGPCPPPCSCVCDVENDSVLIQKKRSFIGDGFECVSRGMASRRVGDGTNNWSCVSDSECPALTPPTDETDGDDEDTTGTQNITENENP